VTERAERTIPFDQIGPLPGDWAEQGLCREVDGDLFFPEKGGSTREAKSVCAECYVRTQCLEYALRTEQRNGIWGGTSERERNRLMRTRKANAA
jgi:WhiB family redox-sensing transcriptional regulator